MYGEGAVLRDRFAAAVSLHRDRPARVPVRRRAAARRIRSLGERSRPQLRQLGLRALCVAGRRRLPGSRCERHLARRRDLRQRLDSRIAWPPAGRPTATAIGHGSTRGAGRGWTTRRGASPCPTTAAGRTCSGTWGWVPGPVRTPRLLRAGAGRVRRRQQLPARDFERQRRRRRLVPARAARGLSAVLCGEPRLFRERQPQQHGRSTPRSSTTTTTTRT